ncbi:MAG: phosphatidate cytidylyltransferase [Candidatus Coatesbacteria bacterium]|nr:phosphatidate cytidylyltransferase [Candidatus Coatesbacteria bacterium]
MAQLKARIITALIAAPLTIALIALYGRLGLSLFILAVTLGGIAEMKRMLNKAGVGVYWGLIAILSCAFAFLGTNHGTICLVLLISVLAILLRGLLSEGETDITFTRVSFSLLTVICLPFLASFAVAIMTITQSGSAGSIGIRLIILLFVVTWACDIAAFFCGRRWGRHKALERISPNKTLEGFVAGLIFSVLTSVLLSAIMLDEFSIGQSALLGLLLGMFGQLGDFCFSLIKRAVKLKDAGGILPGHGGILDRMDSFLFNAPVMYVFIVFSMTKPL